MQLFGKRQTVEEKAQAKDKAQAQKVLNTIDQELLAIEYPYNEIGIVQTGVVGFRNYSRKGPGDPLWKLKLTVDEFNNVLRLEEAKEKATQKLLPAPEQKLLLTQGPHNANGAAQAEKERLEEVARQVDAVNKEMKMIISAAPAPRGGLLNRKQSIKELIDPAELEKLQTLLNKKEQLQKPLALPAPPNVVPPKPSQKAPNAGPQKLNSGSQIANAPKNAPKNANAGRLQQGPAANAGPQKAPNARPQNPNAGPQKRPQNLNSGSQNANAPKNSTNAPQQSIAPQLVPNALPIAQPADKVNSSSTGNAAQNGLSGVTQALQRLYTGFSVGTDENDLPTLVMNLSANQVIHLRIGKLNSASPLMTAMLLTYIASRVMQAQLFHEQNQLNNNPTQGSAVQYSLHTMLLEIMEAYAGLMTQIHEHTGNASFAPTEVQEKLNVARKNVNRAAFQALKPPMNVNVNVPAVQDEKYNAGPAAPSSQGRLKQPWDEVGSNGVPAVGGPNGRLSGKPSNGNGNGNGARSNAAGYSRQQLADDEDDEYGSFDDEEDDEEDDTSPPQLTAYSFDAQPPLNSSPYTPHIPPPQPPRPLPPPPQPLPAQPQFPLRLGQGGPSQIPPAAQDLNNNGIPIAPQGIPNARPPLLENGRPQRPIPRPGQNINQQFASDFNAPPQDLNSNGSPNAQRNPSQRIPSQRIPPPAQDLNNNGIPSVQEVPPAPRPIYSLVPPAPRPTYSPEVQNLMNELKEERSLANDIQTRQTLLDKSNANYANLYEKLTGDLVASRNKATELRQKIRRLQRIQEQRNNDTNKPLAGGRKKILKKKAGKKTTTTTAKKTTKKK